MRVPRKAILGPNSNFHKIWRAHNREFLLQNHAEKRRYLGFIREDIRTHCQKPRAGEQFGDPPPDVSIPVEDRFELYSYCTMSNHVHETGRVGLHLKPFSEHMRRAHGRFGLDYNKRHRRIGKVACERPKTLLLQEDEVLRKAMLYGDCNPVRAGLIKHPTDVRWKGLSSCRFYAWGEESEYSSMLTQPEWYLRLGKTPKQRQTRYRAMLDQYLIDVGLKRDPTMSMGNYCGSSAWAEEMRKRLRELMGRTGCQPAPEERPGPPG